MSKCICNDCQVQVEWKKGDFFDPQNKCLKRTDGKKIRPIWLGCPKHDGNSNRWTPDNKTLIQIADEQQK